MRTNNYLVAGIEPKNVWYRCLSLVYHNGVYCKDERGSEVIELMNLVSRIDKPRGKYPEKIRTNMLEVYGKTLLDTDNNGFAYTYGERIRLWNNQVDQVSEVINKLKTDKNTRRAIMTTWIPTIDFESTEVPCLILIDLKWRDKLDMTAVFRSHDIYGAYPYNIYALNNLLKYIANKINAPIGGITVHSISAHIYSTDIDDVKSVIGEL